MDAFQIANAVRKLCPTADISESALTQSGRILKEQMRSVIKSARVLARHAKRVSITTEDVNQALGLLGHEPVYGSQRFEEQRLLPVDGKDIYFAEDVDISAAEVNSVILECPPAEMQIHSHWLTIDGAQPHVPENEPAPTAKARREKTERPTPSKETTGRKRKSRIGHVDTVQAVTGGMVQGGVELRLPVEHALTAEQQAYYEQIQQHIESISGEGTDADDEQESIEGIEKRIDELRHDAALQPLVPYLIRFVARHVYTTIQDLRALRLTLRILRSLVRNKHIDLGLYSHHILPLVLSSLLSENLGGTNPSLIGEACKVRDYAATTLASAVEAFDDSINNVHYRISQKLSDYLEPETSFIVKYGAIRGLDALRMSHMEAVQKLLQLCSRYVEEKLADLEPASLVYQQGKACAGLIKEILDRPQDEEHEKPMHFQSPLQKRARREDSFV